MLGGMKAGVLDIPIFQKWITFYFYPKGMRPIVNHFLAGTVVASCCNGLTLAGICHTT